MKIEIQLNRQEYSYDVYHLFQAFYPGAELYMEIDSEEDKPIDEEPGALRFSVTLEDGIITLSGSGLSARTAAYQTDAPPIDTKNRLKQLLYRALEEVTGRKLPWGDLSGIRPVKLAEALLKESGDKEKAARRMRELYLVSEEKAQLASEIAAREERLLEDLPLAEGYSLYIDIPFCPSICLYCTFGSNPIGQWAHAVQPYLTALKKELLAIRKFAGEHPLTTVYIGGGTPTSVSPNDIADLLAFLEDTFQVSKAKEFTVEAGRPDTITEEMLSVLKEHRVGRISINPQTMNASTLEVIGRHHTPDDVRRTFDLARKAGFRNINMDMIVGLPGEGRSEVLQTLKAIEQLAPDGLTVHSLALKRAARLNLFRERYAETSFENSAAIMQETRRSAGRLGMYPYYLYRQKNIAGNFENVGYARDGCECLYNILIMEERQTILGAGCGASSKLVLPDGRIERAANVKNLTEYLNRTDEMIERKAAALRATGVLSNATPHPAI